MFPPHTNSLDLSCPEPTGRAIRQSHPAEQRLHTMSCVEKQWESIRNWRFNSIAWSWPENPQTRFSTPNFEESSLIWEFGRVLSTLLSCGLVWFGGDPRLELQLSWIKGHQRYTCFFLRFGRQFEKWNAEGRQETAAGLSRNMFDTISPRNRIEWSGVLFGTCAIAACLTRLRIFLPRSESISPVCRGAAVGCWDSTQDCSRD